MKAALVEKREESPGIKTFILQPEKKIEFIAGQFCFFNFELDGKKFTKHFSFSNSPTRENVEFTTIISDSDYKQALNSLKPGHEFELPQPMGEFTLKKAGDSKIVFLTGGIGLTPVRSMLEYVADEGEEHGMVLFYSNRNEERIVFRKELDELEKKIVSLKVINTLTNLTNEEKAQWKGETGFITAEMVKNYSGDLEDTIFYIVGPPKFNEVMEKIAVEELFIPKERIVLENFAGY